MKNYVAVGWRWFKRKTLLTYSVTILLVASIYLWGPYIESHSFPILSGIRITQVTNVIDADNDKKTCFAISYKKERYAVAKYVVFLAVTPSGEMYDTRVTVGKDGKQVPFKTFSDKQVKAVGTAGTYFWCVQVPNDIEGLTLVGSIRYSTWHRQWDLDQELQTITVPNAGDLPNTNYNEHFTDPKDNVYMDLLNRGDNR